VTSSPAVGKPHSGAALRSIALVLALASAKVALAAEPTRVRTLRILVLSTMLADAGIGEWGFAALVEADGKRLLFDTGARPDTVLQNARELGVDLASVRDVILSHSHADHTGGLMTLRRELSKGAPAALSRVHVGKGIFATRVTATGAEDASLERLRREFEATGGSLVEYDAPRQLAPGVWLTGPVPRLHAERNWSGQGRLRTPEGLVEDTIPEDQSLVVDTERGLVLVSGCGHAGVVNTVALARQAVRPAPMHALIGGFHLFAADDAHLRWTGARLREAGVENLIGAHCTGIEAVFRLREELGLARRSAVVAAVGASFDLGKGIDPRPLAR
jgi:7,8-dihydropterin-6-yl-methyl-4-(beta-D-ribofuranosyl)aminobenzene 5'-phosphate synthase